jgi:hypothetical protein
MDRRVHGRMPPFAAVAPALVLSAVFASNAEAHVKWFCAFNVAGQPRVIDDVLTPDFGGLVGIAILALVAGCLLEGTVLGQALLRAIDRVTNGLPPNADLLIRAVCGFFFVALWTMGGIILTPELKTNSEAISWLQLAIAAGLIWRRTMVFSAAGITALYAFAVHDYGVFHLADYPIFLGVAAYLVLAAGRRDLFGVRPLDVVRYTTGITLMWASIEKWAYPEWSFPLFIEHPALSLGYDPEFFMRAAGVVEFTLAFALLWTPLVRRSAAIVLIIMFVGGAFEFGKLDVIGHAPIVVVLLAIIGDNIATAKEVRRPVLAAPLAYCISLVGFLTIYYIGHAALFGTQIL